jgi:uncharacterized RDD family membrane protein YckC
MTGEPSSNSAIKEGLLAKTPLPPAARVAASYTGGIVVRRWLACWVDMVISVGILISADKLLGNEAYQKWLIAWILVAYSYFVICERLWGRTLGRVLTRTVVVNETGGRPTLGQVAIRTAFRVVEVNPFIFGGVPAGLVAAFTPTHQRLGDLLAKTYVLYSRDLEGLEGSHLP